MLFKKKVKVLYFLICSFSFGIYLSYKPWIHYQEQRILVNQNRIRLKNLEKEWVHLKEEQAEFENSFGKEKMARKRGFRKDNEKSFNMNIDNQ